MIRMCLHMMCPRILQETQVRDTSLSSPTGERLLSCTLGKHLTSPKEASQSQFPKVNGAFKDGVQCWCIGLHKSTT